MDVRLLFAALLAPVAGCGPGTPQAETARPIEDRTPAEDLPPIAATKPDASEPAAATLVNAVLMAHTNSHPSTVEKFVKARVKRKGVVRFAEAQTNATMEIFIWGDQYRATYALESRNNVPETFSISGTTGWRLLPQFNPQPTQLTAADQENVLPDVRGDRMLLLYPLADKRLTAVTAREGKAGGATVLRVWVGDEPPMLVFVDPKTNRVTRISYEGRENGQVITRSLELHDHEVVAGVLLPKRIQYAVGPVALTTWSKIDYEVPAVFELSVFEKP